MSNTLTHYEPIVLTQSAADRVRDQLSKNHAQALRFSARKSGCSGYAYDLGFETQINPDDEIFESFGVQVVVDAQSLPVLSGTMIDYVSEGLNQTFKFSNPKATDECGCGESFAVGA